MNKVAIVILSDSLQRLVEAASELHRFKRFLDAIKVRAILFASARVESIVS